MGSNPALYADLLSDPRYIRAAVNTVLFVGLAVNLQMMLALLLSGFFLRRRRWIRALLVVYILPWTSPRSPPGSAQPIIGSDACRFRAGLQHVSDRA
jgi:multiple sugar transport system permease protein